MLATLFVVILISFIGVGLPDSALGTAWPAIYPEFDLPISLAGYISATISVGTIISSLMSARLIRKLGTGLLTAISILLTAIALLGFSLTDHPAFFFLCALPLGLGAGAIDTALNSFVALHYSAAKMNYLHCFYGLGVAASPFVLSLALGNSENWRRGYLVVAVLQLVITAVSFAALPLWKKVEKRSLEEQSSASRILTVKELLHTKGIFLSCAAFFASCALELTAGGWSSTFFVSAKGLPVSRAASITTLYYIGLTVGRLLSGLLSVKLGRTRILKISLAILPVAVLVFLLPLPMYVTACALFLIGMGIGPVYPNLMHLTPKYFGDDVVESIMGVQQATTYVGILVMPWLFGVLAQTFSTALLPYYLLAMFILYAIPVLLFLNRPNHLNR